MSTLIPIVCIRCGMRGKVASLPKDLTCARCKTGEYLDLDDFTVTAPLGTPEDDDSFRDRGPYDRKKVPMVSGAPPYSDRALATPINASHKQAGNVREMLESRIGQPVCVDFRGVWGTGEHMQTWTGVLEGLQVDQTSPDGSPAPDGAWIILSGQDRPAWLPLFRITRVNGIIVNASRRTALWAVVNRNTGTTVARVESRQDADAIAARAGGRVKDAYGVYESDGVLKPYESAWGRDASRRTYQAKRAQIVRRVLQTNPTMTRRTALRVAERAIAKYPAVMKRKQAGSIVRVETPFVVEGSDIRSVYVLTQGGRETQGEAESAAAQAFGTPAYLAMVWDEDSYMRWSFVDQSPAQTTYGSHKQADWPGPCPCECNSGGFCGGCGHAGCGGRKRASTPSDTCPSCGARLDEATVANGVLTARCNQCSWSGSKRQGSRKHAAGDEYDQPALFPDNPLGLEPGTQIHIGPLVVPNERMCEAGYGDQVFEYVGPTRHPYASVVRELKHGTTWHVDNSRITPVASRKTAKMMPGDKSPGGPLDGTDGHYSGYDSIEKAIDVALQNLPIMKRVVRPEAWDAYLVLDKADQGAYAVYSESAWTPQSESLLPYSSPPPGTIVARVEPDGTVTRIPSRTSGRRTAMPNPVDLGVKVGDIFVSNWGYDQTNIDFYEVVGLTGASVKVRKVKKRHLDDSNLPTTHVVPIPGAYTEEAMTKRIQGGGDSGYSRPGFTLNSYAAAFLWDGTPEMQTGSGWGH